MRSKIRQIAPWLVTLAVLTYLFSQVPFAKVWTAVTHAASWTLPAVLAIILCIYLADCLAIWKTFTWFVAPLTYRQTMTLRGATYLLALVNYALGQGAFVYFLHRSQKVPVVRGAAAVLLIMGTNLLLLLILSTLGLGFGAAMPGELKVLILAGNAALALYIVLMALRPRWLAKRPVLDVLLFAGFTGHLRAMAVRIPHIIALLALNFAILHAFSVRVPLLQALAYLPMVFLVAVIPISVQGLGPTQGAMTFFFQQYAQGDAQQRAASVLAASLSAQAIATCVQILLGVICIRSELVKGLKQEAKENLAKS